ncbi:TlpA family protein disulfide reductase [Micromonospora siamensis]|uniref:Cytochrome c biogenesis protein CcmG, thiol:disulfide interchange protein DsbE n=1 Tax=Micromonospora siamensis TaxID=299152 RepID=A0A1C5I735_9ACTN|nr:TlpA disulfide reductase family protein [Micromonospora siamensis]SCG54037.1 cytochrome c biogenesis protein CcmG, thiol:disulfide interchange protein DsbE [Micromonospora siamensis]
MNGRARVSWWRRVRPVPTVVLLLAAGLGAALAVGHRSGAGETARRPAAAPALAGTTLAGERFDLSAARGHVVVVNVFASWCGPCRDELPLLVETGRQWSPRGLRVVALNLRDGPDAVRALLEQTHADDLTVLPDPDGTRAVEWGVRGVPETFLVDRDGRIVAHQSGVVTRQWLRERLSPLLESP